MEAMVIRQLADISPFHGVLVDRVCGLERFGPVTDIITLYVDIFSVVHIATMYWDMKICQNYGPIFELLRRNVAFQCSMGQRKEVRFIRWWG